MAVITGKQAWAIMAGGILLYELSCEEEELLSCVVDGWLVTHPVLTRSAIAAVALHLSNSLPDYLDPLSISFVCTRKVADWAVKARKREYRARRDNVSASTL